MHLPSFYLVRSFSVVNFLRYYQSLQVCEVYGIPY